MRLNKKQTELLEWLVEGQEEWRGGDRRAVEQLKTLLKIRRMLRAGATYREMHKETPYKSLNTLNYYIKKYELQ